jgi:hypothetical protein
MIDNYRIQINWLIRRSCIFCEIKQKEIYLNTNKHSIVKARAIVMTILFRHTPLTSREISLIFNREHATVFHAKKIYENLMDTNRNFNEEVSKIEEKYMEKFLKLKRFVPINEDISMKIFKTKFYPKKSIARMLVCH